MIYLMTMNKQKDTDNTQREGGCPPPACSVSRLNESVIGLLSSLESHFTAEAQRAGEHKRDFMEEWDEEMANQFEGRREAFIQAAAEVQKYRLSITGFLKQNADALSSERSGD